MVASTRALELLESPIGLELLYLVDWRRETFLMDDQLFSRAIEARNSASIYRGDYAEHVRYLRSRAHRYRDLAEEVARRMSDWWAPLDRAAQVWAHRRPGPPASPDLVTDLSQAHLEVPKPKRALWTSTFRRGLVSPWLNFPQNANRSHLQHTWRLVVADSARVAEIHSPADWWSLVRAYPAQTLGFRYAMKPLASKPKVLTQDRSHAHGRIDPDWEALAHDWDAVHVSMAGVMTAEDVTFERDRLVTELRGWDVESTVWLRWVFTSVEKIDVQR